MVVFIAIPDAGASTHAISLARTGNMSCANARITTNVTRWPNTNRYVRSTQLPQFSAGHDASSRPPPTLSGSCRIDKWFQIPSSVTEWSEQLGCADRLRICQNTYQHIYSIGRVKFHYVNA